MYGKALFDKYTSLRDFSGNAADEYAQLLTTILSHIGDAIFPLLEKAEKNQKQLSIKDDTIDEIIVSDVVFIGRVHQPA